jgi:hypothetical protein
MQSISRRIQSPVLGEKLELAEWPNRVFDSAWMDFSNVRCGSTGRCWRNLARRGPSQVGLIEVLVNDKRCDTGA